MASLLKRAAEPATQAAVQDAKKVDLKAPPKVVQEVDVGITQYINQAPVGFYGAIKQRYSDFQVFELDQDGSVVHLKDQGPDLGISSKEKRQEKRRQALENRENEDKSEQEAASHAGGGDKGVENDGEKGAEEKGDGEAGAEEKGDGEAGAEEAGAEENAEEKAKFSLSEEYQQKLSEYLSNEEISSLQTLMNEGGKMQTSTQFNDKATRTQLHQLFRQAFDGKLESSTSADNRFQFVPKSSGNTQTRKNNHVNHVDENGIINYGLGPYKNYLHFTVYKENKETMEVANTLTKFLRIPNKTVKYSGTKDRRGVTCQRFCIHKAKVARVTSLNKALRGTVLGGFEYKDSGLDLGDLAGNEFVIAIRDARVLGDSEAELSSVVQKCFESLSSTGFINYFGLQRFGTFSVSTHELGVYLLREDWKGAVELILAEQERVVPDSVDARRTWAETGNAAAALKLMPRRCSAEHAVLSSLAKNKTDEPYTTDMYFRAILNIPRNLRLIYVHAYQSYVWNLVASKRIELFGLSVQEGDLVYAQKEESGFAEDTAETGASKVHALTAEDVQAGTYSIYDVVLPSPGYDVQYPTNPQLMQVYEQAMKKDSLDPHKMARKIREFSLAGSYRKLMARARDVSYTMAKYKDDDDSILRTDLEMLRARDEEELSQRVISAPPGAEKTAVVLRMQLGVSSYATMALREFMKAPSK